MSRYERSEFMKGVLFAEEQKSLGWKFKTYNYEEQSLTWEWNKSNEDGSFPRQIIFAENDYFDGVMAYQEHLEALDELRNS